MTIGERMRDARKAKGLTQAALAEKVRLKRNTIANYETNNIEPSERSVFDICAVLGINEKWLLTGEGEMLRQLSEDEELELIFDQIHMSTDQTIRAIIRAYWKLPDNAKEAVRQFIMTAAGDQCHHRPQQRQAGRHLRPYQPAGQAGRS